LNDKPTFITEDSSFFGHGKLDPADEGVIREVAEGGGVRIRDPEQLQLLKRAAEQVVTMFRAMTFDMTKEQAEMIRRWRVDEGYSWRAVASAAFGLAPAWTWDPSSNQLAGMAVCEKAAELHGENFMQPPWNG